MRSTDGLHEYVGLGGARFGVAGHGPARHGKGCSQRVPSRAVAPGAYSAIWFGLVHILVRQRQARHGVAGPGLV